MWVDYEMSRRQSQLLIVLLIISVGATAGVWIYQDSQLKQKEDELRTANLEYNALEFEYVILDERYTDLDEEHVTLAHEYVILDEEYVTLDEEYTKLRESVPGMVETAFVAGHEEGNVTGYEQGMDFGELIGYRDGYDSGQTDGYGSGYAVGIEDGYYQGVDSGYDSGYLVGAEAYAVGDFEGIYWFVRDPTYAEVKAFILTDSTDKMVYQKNVFTCADFAYSLRSNAYKNEYRCFGVYIILEGGAHMIVGFNTTDRGMVFIEPQNDYFVKLEVGVSYWNTALQTTVRYAPSYSDIIVRWNIHW